MHSLCFFSLPGCVSFVTWSSRQAHALGLWAAPTVVPPLLCTMNRDWGALSPPHSPWHATSSWQEAAVQFAEETLQPRQIAGSDQGDKAPRCKWYCGMVREKNTVVFSFTKFTTSRPKHSQKFQDTAVTCSSLVVVFTVTFSDALSWDCCLHKPLAASLNMVSFSSKLSCLAIGKARGLLQRESIKQLDSCWRRQSNADGTSTELRYNSGLKHKLLVQVLKRNWWEINCSHRLVCSQRHTTTYFDLKFTFMHVFSEAELSKPKRICMSLLLTALGWQINSQFCNRI